MLSEGGLDIERWGPRQQRAITFLWAATQVVARVVQEAFLEVYSSLPDSGNGHTSLKDYCNLMGRINVYMELLDEGCMLDVLIGSPREKTFLDLKVTRKILEKVIAERYGKDKCGKLMFEIRQLVYLRNDLCHQLLPALTLEQFLSRMKQLENRLCDVVNEAAALAGATHTPDKALQDIRALFDPLLNRDKTQAEDTQLPAEDDPRPPHDKPLLEIGTQTDFPPPVTLEKDTQTESGMQLPATLETTPCHTPEDAPQNTTTLSASFRPPHDKPLMEIGTQTDHPPPPTLEKGTQVEINSKLHDLGEGMCGDASQNTERITPSPENPAAPERFNVSSSVRGNDGGNEKSHQCENIKGERPGKQEGRKQGRHEACCDACPFSPLSPMKSPPPHASRNLHGSYSTHSNPRAVPLGPPRHKVCHGNFVTPSRLTYDSVTINHIFTQSPDNDRVPLVMKVILFLVVLTVSLLPYALTLIRVLLHGIQCSWVRADKGCRYLCDLWYGPTWQKTIIVPEVVLVPRLDPLEMRAPVMEPHQFQGIGMNCFRGKCKQGKRKGRRN
ncbi:uncharacterized protein LOC127008228 [Eriocheir sinensis]|uniref:uncharacterized protein LOC127008228 n=1 Tax=Eriocheir sinensis TaxID=95602 RepID=UPI0021C6B88B|nr:uncharacterized protein LOC127008228 [Eriocheir sinensis]